MVRRLHEEQGFHLVINCILNISDTTVKRFILGWREYEYCPDIKTALLPVLICSDYSQTNFEGFTAILSPEQRWISNQYCLQYRT